MKHSRRIIASTLAIFGALAVASGQAHASDGSSWGYVCEVIQYPMASSMGSEGYINFQLYSGASCGGSYVGSYYLMSTGNSYPGVNYYTTASQLTLFRNLLQAEYAAKKVYVYTPAAPSNVASGIYFYAYN